MSLLNISVNSFKFLLVVSAMLAGIVLVLFSISFTFNFESSGKFTSGSDDNETIDPNLIIFREVCLFLGFFLTMIPLGVLYTQASGGILEAKLKLLDWGLVAFILLLIPLFEVIMAPPFLWVLLVVLPAVIARMIITWMISKDEAIGKGEN